VLGQSPWDNYTWVYDANCGTSGCTYQFHSTSNVQLDGHVIWMTSRQCTNPSGLTGCSSWATLANYTSIWNGVPYFWDTAQVGPFNLADEVISGAHFVWTLPYTTTNGTSSGTTIQTALDPESDSAGNGFWTCVTSNNNADRTTC
jgi:hypothetical protein